MISSLNLSKALAGKALKRGISLEQNILLQWLCVIFLGGYGISLIVFNAVIFYKGWIKGEKQPSVCPFGGLPAAIAILLIPNNKYLFLCIIPLILDWGSIPAIIRFIWVFMHNKDMFKK